MHLRLATTRPLPEPDPDEELLLAALRARGIEARMAAWNDPGEDWSAPVPTVIRSTWDYIHAHARFLDWADATGRAAPLWNPPAIVRANAHKGYLAELAARGHAVVPTEIVPRHWRGSLRELCATRGWNEVVLKPAVSAGSFGTARFAAPFGPDADRHFAWLVQAGDALVQPYVASVEGHGERALVWIDGEFTHAVRKTARFTGQDEQVSEALAIEPAELELGRALLAPLAAELLYARVDVARDGHGRPQVMELELIEPSLFLRQHPPALERLVRAIARRLR